MHRRIRLIVIGFLCYALLAYGGLWLLNIDPPRGLESLIVLFAMPLNLLTLPWISPLSALGLIEGEWMRFPTPLGMLILFSLYALFLYLLLWLSALLWRRLHH